MLDTNPTSSDLSRSESHSDSRLGFLTAIELPQVGCCGGLLVVTAKGRPIEFHCTAPLLPNRAQEILYGKTLPDFLLCDQIGQTLIEALTSNPQVIVTDCGEMVGLAEHSSTPIAWLAPKPRIDRLGEDDSIESPATALSNRKPSGDDTRLASPCPPESQAPFRLALELDSQPVSLWGERSEGVDAAAAILKTFAELLPLGEPFERIRNAIEEAHKVAA